MIIHYWFTLFFAFAALMFQGSVADVHPLPLPNDASPRIFPSPDGTKVAYERGVRLNGHRDYYICILDTVTIAEPVCHLAPQQPASGYEPAPDSAYIPLSWSPDGNYIALVGQPLVALLDTDLLLLDTRSGEWRNLADDGYEGQIDATAGAPQSVTVDIQPTWSPDGTTLAVERVVIGADGTFTSQGITLLDIASGTFTPLVALSPTGTAGTTNSLAWSPDGSALAVSVQHAEPDAAVDGLWHIDLASAQPERILALQDADALLRQIYAETPLQTLGPVFWSPDSTRLLFWIGNPSERPAVAWFFWMDLATRTVNQIPLPAHPNDNAERRMVRPIQAAWSPDSQALLVLTFGLGPDDPATPLDPAGSSPRLSVRTVSLADGSDQLIGHLPLGTSTALYYAVWGAQGDAVTNGYYLKITP